MNIDAMRSQYAEIRQVTAFAPHKKFINELMLSEDEKAVSFHYELLRNRENHDLYLRLRAAFMDRGDAAEAFLLERVKDERDSEMRADLLTILGSIRSSAALPLAREAIVSEAANLRYGGCYVLGWMGKARDLDLLRDRLLSDPDPDVRATAATAYDQIHDHLPKSRDRILRDLKDALVAEEDETVAGWIIVTIQYILKKRFGMKENIEEAELTGDVVAAKEKCLRALSRLKV